MAATGEEEATGKGPPGTSSGQPASSDRRVLRPLRARLGEDASRKDLAGRLRAKQAESGPPVGGSTPAGSEGHTEEGEAAVPAADAERPLRPLARPSASPMSSAPGKSPTTGSEETERVPGEPVAGRSGGSAAAPVPERPAFGERPLAETPAAGGETREEAPPALQRPRTMAPVLMDALTLVATAALALSLGFMLFSQF
jgi:hypothetical protein